MCFKCNKWVEPKGGTVYRDRNGRWVTRHNQCITSDKSELSTSVDDRQKDLFNLPEDV